MTGTQHHLAVALTALAVLLLLSGLDDLVPLAICLSHRFRRSFDRRRRPQPLRAVHSGTTIERPIAIFVPCWKESGVIGEMVRRNLAAVRYSNFDFFLGVYPNDEETVQVARELSRMYRNVHVATNGRDGPTSKADCLNAIYAAMCEYEGRHAVHFNTVVLHDAEDLMDPASLGIINRERCRYAMVQVPVLPLPTPISDFTHGVYCDEFAEFQMIDMPARSLCGSFVPSNGVGTGFARHVLQRLACERPHIFDPHSLTEDYELGVYIHKIGHHQLFVSLPQRVADTVATREYFPRRWRSAVRQRTRWVTGIALQGWERDGWRGSLSIKYWFWRDRKGLVANPLGFLTNLLTVLAAADYLLAAATHRRWLFDVGSPALLKLYIATGALQWLRVTVRMVCVGRLYGSLFALALPLRGFYANLINCTATFSALHRFALAKTKREPLVWLKTEHSYPAHDAIPMLGRDLRDVLAASGLVSEERMRAFGSGTDEEILEALLRNGIMTEDERCQVLSLQSGLPLQPLDVHKIRPEVVRSLPRHVEARYRIVPFSVRDGKLLVASPSVPPPGLNDELRRWTRLKIEPHLVTRADYEELRAML